MRFVSSLASDTPRFPTHEWLRRAATRAAITLTLVGATGCSSAAAPDEAERIGTVAQALCDNDGTCEPAEGETYESCGGDCYCYPDGICDSPFEDHDSCPADCSAPGGSGGAGSGSAGSGNAGSGSSPDCCGDATDPCSWSGDGVCDQGCAWGADSDCNTAGTGGAGGSGSGSGGSGNAGAGGTGAGGSTGGAGGSPVSNCCEDPTDPCGWNGDGFCDTACAWGQDVDCNTGTGGAGTGSGGSGSGGSGSGYCYEDGFCDLVETCESCPSDCCTSGGDDGTSGGSSAAECCGSADDPCGWSGDGICDAGCAWGADPDCAGGAQNGETDGTPDACGDSCSCGSMGAEAPPASLNVSRRWDVGVDCPLFGGRASVELGLSGATTAAGAVCPSYEATGNGATTFGIAASLCGDTFFGQGAGSFEGTRRYESVCAQDTCERASDSQRYCDSTSATGSGSVGTSQLLTFEQTWSQAAEGSLPAITLEMSCGVNMTGDLSADASASITENSGAAGCSDCTTADVTLSAKTSGSGGCQIRGLAGSHSFSFDCPSCATVEMNVTGGSAEGECAGDCATVAVDATTTVDVPCFQMPIGGWFENAVKCTASAAGRSEADSCTGESAPTQSTSLDCQVVPAAEAAGCLPVEASPEDLACTPEGCEGGVCQGPSGGQRQTGGSFQKGELIYKQSGSINYALPFTVFGIGVNVEANIEASTAYAQQYNLASDQGQVCQNGQVVKETQVQCVKSCKVELKFSEKASVGLFLANGTVSDEISRTREHGATEVISVKAGTPTREIEDLCRAATAKHGWDALCNEAKLAVPPHGLFVKSTTCDEHSDCDQSNYLWSANSKEYCVPYNVNNPEKFYTRCKRRGHHGTPCGGKGSYGAFEWPCAGGYYCATDPGNSPNCASKWHQFWGTKHCNYECRANGKGW